MATNINFTLKNEIITNLNTFVKNFIILKNIGSHKKRKSEKF